MPLYWQVVCSGSLALSLGALSTAWFARMTAREASASTAALVEAHLKLFEALLEIRNADGKVDADPPP